jgi:Protein of unknown function (DUF1670)
MIRSQAIEDQHRLQRLDAKTLDSQFRRRIEEGAKCPPLISEAILKIVKEVFPLQPEDATLDLGQIKLIVVSAVEPPGKSLEQCQKVTVRLTLDAGRDDVEVRRRDGIVGLRRARVLRLTVEAREQGGLLSYEDLAYRLLNCGIRTIVRDVVALRRRDIEVPSRGQQQDMGPGQTHRVQAVRLFLQGLEAQEIARRLYHSLQAIENYVTTFTRVVVLANKGYGDDECAFILQRSPALVAAYRQLYHEFRHQESAQARLREILPAPQPQQNQAKSRATNRPGRSPKKRGQRP